MFTMGQGTDDFILVGDLGPCPDPGTKGFFINALISNVGGIENIW